MPFPLRSDFPMLTQKRSGKGLVYLDSAATSLKPWPVIERLGQFYSYETSNVHRGAHHYSDEATANFENSRKTIQNFLGASDPSEIVFVRNTTEAINLVATSWGESHLHPGDEILLTELEHHSNIVPWQILAKKVGAKLTYVPMDSSGDLDVSCLKSLLTPKVKILSLTHCSNVLGSITMDLKGIVKAAHDVGAKVFVDGAQFVSIHPVNVDELDVDFYAFSGHKLFGPFGIGVLYGKREILNSMPPYQGGGSMIQSVGYHESSFLPPPQRFEAGTPHVAGVIGLAAAIEYVKSIGWERIHQIESNLTEYAIHELMKIEGLSLVGAPRLRAPILSLQVEGCHPSDLAQILNEENVAVRAGHLCAQPLLQKLGLKSFLRASFSIFNTESDVQALVEALKKAKGFLK